MLNELPTFYFSVYEETKSSSKLPTVTTSTVVSERLCPYKLYQACLPFSWQRSELHQNLRQVDTFHGNDSIFNTFKIKTQETRSVATETIK